MEKIIDFIKGPFSEFIDGPIIPLTITIVSAIYFVVIYCKENNRINKERKERLQKIIDEKQDK